MRWRTQMQCNIDAKGKAVRLIHGIIALTVGTVLMALAQLGFVQGSLWVYIAIAIIIVGIFCIVEGWAGWCALRAMGFKTRL